ncbi:helix-turn-helix domain-containing protein [Streptomyces sp. NBC_00237]|uniref:helix-turn-helix domain-containing protein n=1 Tax=Streptomyces sp. NBC_00237 TaxID=2975687 RepID=UPI0022506D52|nr:helix-turn-helix transcriptional regulator [Streptomyces sp. NBC_00237]MCX5206884.1 helix-turn-helix domain-containing protein [Streptomyces sp. NBC_00237]
MGNERRCTQCGCPLSRYNPDGLLCGACEKEAPRPAAQAVTIPAQVWSDSEIKVALRAMDFGLVSRLVRKLAGLRQEDFARLTGLSQGYLSQLESGSRRLSRLDKAQAFLDALKVPEGLRPVSASAQNSRTSVGDAGAATSVGLHDLAAGAAETSGLFAELIAPSNVDDDTLEQLGFTVSRIATDYVHAPLLPLFNQLIAVRDELFSLLRGRQRPQQSRELFMLAGTVCLLLAHASQNLGDQQSAMTQIRTARSCAEQADHTGLRAWIAGTVALITEWSPQSRMSLKLIEHAASLAPAGESRIRIAAIEARTAARVGDHTRALAAIGRMHQAQEETPQNDGLGHFGGLLTFPMAKQDYYLGGAYTLIGQYDEARTHATAAIEAYRSGPREERSYGDEALAQIDLITVGIIQGDTDGATTAVRHILDLPPEMRIRQLGTAMTRLSSLMGRPALRGNRDASELADLIQCYRVMDGATALPSLR